MNDFNQFYETVENAHKYAYSNIKVEYETNIFPDKCELPEPDNTLEIMSESIKNESATTYFHNDLNEVYVAPTEDFSTDVEYDPADMEENAKLSSDDQSILAIFSLSCKDCSVSFNTYDSFSSHYKKNHDSKGILECCTELFQNKSTALRHANSHLNPEKLACTQCEKSFKDKQILSIHMLTHLPDSEKSYECQYCFERFAKAHMLKKHMLKHPDEKEYKCDECNKIVKSKSALASHKKVVHDRAYEQMCHICARIFSTRSSLEYHYKSFHQVYRIDETVECQVCGSILKDKYIHKRHMLRHMESRIPCDICGKDYPNTNALKMHKKRSHVDGRIHMCSVCGKGFKRELVLKEHMATHTGEVYFTNAFYLKYTMNNCLFYFDRFCINVPIVH